MHVSNLFQPEHPAVLWHRTGAACDAHANFDALPAHISAMMVMLVHAHQTVCSGPAHSKFAAVQSQILGGGLECAENICNLSWDCRSPKANLSPSYITASQCLLPRLKHLILLVQNALGVFAAGGLGGLLLLQKQDKEKSEDQLSSQLQGERKTVGDLKQQVSFLLSASPGFLRQDQNAF